MHARLTRYTGVPPESIDPVIDDWKRNQLPFLESRPGFVGAVLMDEHVAGLVTVVTLWSSRATLEASEDAAAKLRSIAQTGFGHWDRPIIDRYEVEVLRLGEGAKGAAA